MPRGRGWRTSFWMMRNGPKQGLDERFIEIDVCEQDSSDRTTYSANWHNWRPHSSFGVKRRTADLAADFHVYGAEFTPNVVRFYLDDALVHSIDVQAVPHYDQHIWLTSVATWLGRISGVEDAALLELALFDWVRYYRPDTPEAPVGSELNLGTMLQPVPESARFIDPDYYIWCGSLIRGDDRKYHLFYSRWARKLGHYAWVTHSEIAHAVSDSPTGPFQHVNGALPARGNPFWDGSRRTIRPSSTSATATTSTTWAPSVTVRR